MKSNMPKQYMHLGGRKIIDWTVRSLVDHERIEGVFVGLAANDDHQDWVRALHPKVLDVFGGGDTRSETVHNGLAHMLRQGCSGEDWVLVHDSNRPFLSSSEITDLILKVGDDDNGGLLSLPIHDTVKRDSRGRVSETLPRGELFRAQTPQMFKLGLLNTALEQCIRNDQQVTDESQAMEMLGYRPLLVQGRDSNIKITTPDDLRIASAICELGVD